MADNDLISRSSLLDELQEELDFDTPMLDEEQNKLINTGLRITVKDVKRQPAVDAVSRPVVEQIRWERDCAIQQLKDHGIPFGGIAPDVVKVVRCKDCKYYDTHGYKICALHSEPPDLIGAGANIYMDKDDFCSYGERRADDGK